MMTYLFLDTEWADAAGRELVSLALVSDDGKHEFYAEIDPLPKAPTDFVRAMVYPLLDRHRALQRVDFTAALRKFLESVPEPSVLADYPNDLTLLEMALAGFDVTEPHPQVPDTVQKPVMTHMLKEGITQRVLEDWFKAHPDQARRRHHALVDARALRATWLALTDRDDGSWSPSLTAWKGQ